MDVYSDEYGIPYDDPPDGSDDDPAGKKTRSGRRRIRMLLIYLAAAALIVLAAVMVVRRINRESSPGSEFTPLLMQDVEPDFTRGGGWPPEVEAVFYTLPALIKNELTVIGQQQGYEFQGVAGQMWVITVEPQEGSLIDPVVSLYAPPGVEIASNDDRASGDVTAELVVTLPQNGPYRLLVESSEGGVTTGAYLLTVLVR
jgi:hypothetical protein